MAFIWGTAFVAQRVGMDTIGPITFSAARMILSAVVVGPVAFFMWLAEKKDPDRIGGSDIKQYNKNTMLGGLGCGLLLAVSTIIQQFGLVYTTAGKAGFITAMYILIVPIMTFLLFKKKSPWLVWFAVLLGVVGMFFLCITDDLTLTKGDMLVGVCAVLFSCHIICCDHFVRFASPVRMSAIQFAVAALVSTLAAFIVEAPTIDKIIPAMIPIAYCGIVSGGIGYTLQIVAQKITDPIVASLLMSMEAVFAAVSGAILLNERMSPRELSGSLIMLSAIILVQIPVKKKKVTG